MKESENGKSKTISLLTGILILAIGIILIICNKMITGRGIVVLAGILFLLTGIINLVLYITRKNPDGEHTHTAASRFLGWLVSIAAIILGLCMLVFIDTFNQMIPFIFGLLIFFGALILIITYIFNVRKIVSIPVWCWLFPIVMVVLGIITITQKADVSDPLIMILTGSSMIIFGFAGTILGALVSGAKRKALEDQKNLHSQTIEVTPKEITTDYD